MIGGRLDREGTYRGHQGDVLQLLCLGDCLLSLGSDGRLLVWTIGEYAKPKASTRLLRCAPPLSPRRLAPVLPYEAAPCLIQLAS
jgi:hypothetical protein